MTARKSAQAADVRGVIDRTVDFVARNMGTKAWLEGGRRRRKKPLPLDAVREAVVNAAAHRNYTIALRDYGYVEHLGMGVRNRIIKSMQEHNGTEPDLIEEEHRFTVRLWKTPRA